MKSGEVYKHISSTINSFNPMNGFCFETDYDICDILVKWGNWARQDVYNRRQSSSLYRCQKMEYKSCCSDDEGLLIDALMVILSKLELMKFKYHHEILKLYYYGQETFIDGVMMIIPRSLRAISRKIGLSESNVRVYKRSGESCIMGMLSMQTVLTSSELSIPKKFE